MKTAYLDAMFAQSSPIEHVPGNNGFDGRAKEGLQLEIAVVFGDHGPSNTFAALRRQQHRVMAAARIDGLYISGFILEDFHDADNSGILAID